jgi:uncharacterized protein (DUF4415 family)
MSAKRTTKRSREPDAVPRGRADLRRLRRLSDREIAETSPSDLRDLPADFWDDAEVVVPPSKLAVSLRLDEDVLEWFKEQGPKYQTRINAVLRTYVSRAKRSLPAPRARRSRRKAS